VLSFDEMKATAGAIVECAKANSRRAVPAFPLRKSIFTRFVEELRARWELLVFEGSAQAGDFSAPMAQLPERARRTRRRRPWAPSLQAVKPNDLYRQDGIWLVWLRIIGARWTRLGAGAIATERGTAVPIGRIGT